MITLPSTLTTVDLQHGYRSGGPIRGVQPANCQPHRTRAQLRASLRPELLTAGPFAASGGHCEPTATDSNTTGSDMEGYR